MLIALCIITYFLMVKISYAGYLYHLTKVRCNTCYACKNKRDYCSDNCDIAYPAQFICFVWPISVVIFINIKLLVFLHSAIFAGTFSDKVVSLAKSHLENEKIRSRISEKIGSLNNNDLLESEQELEAFINKNSSV